MLLEIEFSKKVNLHFLESGGHSFCLPIVTRKVEVILKCNLVSELSSVWEQSPLLQTKSHKLVFPMERILFLVINSNCEVFPLLRDFLTLNVLRPE